MGGNRSRPPEREFCSCEGGFEAGQEGHMTEGTGNSNKTRSPLNSNLLPTRRRLSQRSEGLERGTGDLRKQ